MERLELAVKRVRLANVAALAGEKLDENADPSRLNANWRERFVAHASNIADEDMHEAWSRILAGEVNAPGSFSIRTVATVADMQRHDAQSFRELCQFTWHVGSDPFNPPALVVVRFGVPGTPLARGIGFNQLNDLESFGLVASANYTIAARVGGGAFVLSHAGDPACTIALRTQDDGFEIPMGAVSFTTTGNQLASIVDVEKPPPEYVDACFRHWEQGSALGRYQVERGTRGEAPDA